MMNDFIFDLNRQLNTQLQTITLQDVNIIQKSRLSAKCISEALIRLRDFIIQYTFCNESEEIYFFKTIKPEILSKYVFHSKIFQIESRRPVGSRIIHEAYYRKEIENLNIFQARHPDFFQYYRSGETYLDNKYFIRNQDHPCICDVNILSVIDPKFSTSHDFLAAKIIACDYLSTYLNRQIDELLIPIQPTITDTPWLLQWTGSKASLVELIYALCSSGTINNGRCGISQLSTLFEKIFQIKLPNIYQIYGEVKYRSNPTRYLDQLKVALLRKFEENE